MIWAVLGLGVLGVLWAVLAALFNSVNEGIVLLVFTLLFAWPALAYFVIARWRERSVFGLPIRVVAVPGALVGLVLLWHAEIAVLAWTLHRCPPPRPMFHNEFVASEWVLLPYWEAPSSNCDRSGHWIWADYKDNVLVVVATRIPVGGSGNEYILTDFATLQPGLRESVIQVRYRDGLFITLPRTRNALVVVLPDGTMGRFPLPEGEAEGFHRPRKLRGSKNMLREAVALLAPADGAKCEEFLRGYTEPRLPEEALVHPPQTRQ